MKIKTKWPPGSMLLGPRKEIVQFFELSPTEEENCQVGRISVLLIPTIILG